jgi:1-acyl-sn-glycerol-3-phosphate acyltransferase
VHYLYQLWAKLFFGVSGIPVEVEFRFQPQKNQAYIFCPNHSSYLDVAVLSYALSEKAVFVGKNSLASVPLFGFVFSRVHLGVDRERLRSRYEVMQRAAQRLQQGQSLVIFPEGGFFSENPPALARFKDGAFRLAAENKIPIVPVTMPYNWEICPGDAPTQLKRRKAKIIIHPPVFVNEGSEKELTEALKHHTWHTINQTLREHGVLPT